MDQYLQGEKGEKKLYVNSVGKVIESTSVKESSAGNDLYLTIDADLQKAAYDMLEQELAGILLAKMSDVLDYDRSQCTDAADVIVASGDIYYQFIANDIIVWIISQIKMPEKQNKAWHQHLVIISSRY